MIWYYIYICIWKWPTKPWFPIRGVYYWHYLDGIIGSLEGLKLGDQKSLLATKQASNVTTRLQYLSLGIFKKKHHVNRLLLISQCFCPNMVISNDRSGDFSLSGQTWVSILNTPPPETLAWVVDRFIMWFQVHVRILRSSVVAKIYHLWVSEPPCDSKYSNILNRWRPWR